MRFLSSALLAGQLLTISAPALAAPPAVSVETAMAYAAEQGILAPVSDGLMHPEMPLTRLDLVRGIVHDVYLQDVSARCFDRIAPKKKSGYTHLFSDVPRTAAYAPEICAGMLTGIVQGKADGSFLPFEGATLAETAKVVAKAYGIAPAPSLQLQKNVPWHEPYWYALARRNAIPDRLREDRHEILTRGEFAVILYELRTERPRYGARYEPVAAASSPISAGTPHAAAVPADGGQIPAAPVTDAGRAIVLHVQERLASRMAIATAAHLPPGV